ncbi:hypothetical protein HDU98_004883 [Podochytrium sp. JEL0797]|nr:hypothetical protein HDU98_004883 [Podochytrium sp. JEL0797]
MRFGRLHLLLCFVLFALASATCPLRGKCPYVADADAPSNAEAAECPLKTGGCPYYDHHKSDKTLADFVTEDANECPLKGKCPFYKDIKDGKKVDLSGSKCPLKDKWQVVTHYSRNCFSDGFIPCLRTSYYFKKDFDHGSTGHAHHASADSSDSHDVKDCPYLKTHPGHHLSTPKSCGCTKSGGTCACAAAGKPCTCSGDSASSAPPAECPYKKSAGSVQDVLDLGTEGVGAVKSPLKHKCPYVDEHHVAHDGKGCPLKNGGCPYFSEHKGDKNIADMLEHEGGCPLKEKCPYYEAIKNGEKVDLSGHACPLADKCPYYKEVKDHGGVGGCPLEKKCPHFKKDFEAGQHAHHSTDGSDSHHAKDWYTHPL